MGIAVSYHDTAEKLQGLSWSSGGPFDRPEWFALLEEAGAQVLIACASEGDRAVALPLMWNGNKLCSLVNWFSFVWRPLGTDAPLLEALMHHLRCKTYRIDLSPVPGECGSATMLEQAFRKAGWLVFREQCDVNHILPVNGRNFAEYWASRPGQMRSTLKRKAGKVDVEILDHFDEHVWSDYRAIYAKSWKPREERADILEAFARAEGAAGRIRLGIARAEGKPVAAQFWTVENGTAYIHKLAHIEAAKSLSAGTTLTAALFEHVIDTDKVELVDFGTGSDGYKPDWMEQVRPRYCLTCLDWRQPRAWPAIAKAFLRRLAPRKAGG